VGASQHVAAFTGRGSHLFTVPTSAEKPLPLVSLVAVSRDGAAFAAGTSDGKLALLDRKGQRQWAIGGIPEADIAKWEAEDETWKQAVKKWEAEAKQWDDKYKDKPGEKPKRPSKPPQPKKPQPDPYLAGAFGSDGRTLVALTAKEAHVFRVADGQKVGSVERASGKVPPSGLVGNLLVSDGRRMVAWLSPSEGKFVGEVAMPKEGVVSLAVTNDGFLVGTETDGTVRKLKAIAGRAVEQIVWEHRAPQRLVKKVAATADRVAIAYWGGTVHLLDAAGQVTHGHLFPQHIADLAWLGDRLVVGLADGRVVAMEAK